MSLWRSPARVLLVGAERALLFVGDGRRLRRSYEFRAGEAGWSAFAAYLAQAPHDPLQVLVDVVEEEYRQDSIPRVRGADRDAVLARRFARLFRGTPYSLALAQGREKEGRRDERVLLTALTRPDTLAPWVAAIIEARVPLAGIHSLPVLSAGLLRRLRARGSESTGNVLFVSVQQLSGLRQTFYRDGHLKISRLATMPRLGAVPYATHVLSELAKLRRYLNSLALVSRDSPLSIYILSHGQWLAELEAQCRNTDGEQYYLVDNAQLARRLGLGEDFASPYSDAIFAQLLLEATPATHYASRQETRYHRLYQARLGLYAASALLLLGSAGWSALRFVEAVGLRHQALDAANKSAYYEERFALARSRLPPTVVEAAAIETAVAAAERLRDLRASPVPSLRLLGTALAAQPSVTLDSLSWERRFDPNETDDGAAATASAPPVPLSPDYAYYTVTALRAHLAAFDGDYRVAIATVDALAATLRAAPDVARVDVQRYPLDLRPAASVAGSVDPAAGGEAAFELRIVQGVPHVRHPG